jgi:hypothetical protein
MINSNEEGTNNKAMRISKYRAWDLYNDRMLEIGDLESISLNKDLDFANYIVMQYTGVKLSGKEICEGDLIAVFSYKDIVDGKLVDTKKYEVAEVVFKDGGFTMGEDGEILLGAWVDEDSCSLVGNKFENPELLN